MTYFARFWTVFCLGFCFGVNGAGGVCNIFRSTSSVEGVARLFSFGIFVLYVLFSCGHWQFN